LGTRYPSLAQKPEWAALGLGLAFSCLLTFAACGSPSRSQADDISTRPADSKDKIAFVLQPLGNSDNSDIYVGDENGRDLAAITTYSGADFYPDWVGNTMVFVSDQDESENVDLYRMDTTSGEVIRLTSNPAIDTAPALSPDGKTVAFTRNLYGQDEIFLVNMEAGAETRLTSNTDIDASPDWAPDGSELTFARNVDGNVDVYVADIDGSNLERVTTDPGAEDDPAWSPDGSKIAYVHRPDSGVESSSSIEVLTLQDGSTTNFPAANGVRYLAWSPDSEWILFTTSREQDGSSEIRAVALDGRTKVLGRFSKLVEMPTWR
jgi:TolB protein